MISDPRDSSQPPRDLRSAALGALAASLEAMGLRSLEGTPLEPGGDRSREAAAKFVGQFRDDAGHRRSVDRAFLGFMLGVRIDRSQDDAELTTDVRLWDLVLQGDGEGAAALISTGRGPLMPEGERKTIETWTESELCALHALSRLSIGTPGLRSRVESAADWLVNELQPDNATSHPWACHVFLERWVRRGDLDHKLYGETLVQNCTVARATPDRFSACILVDSARCLREFAPAG